MSGVNPELLLIHHGGKYFKLSGGNPRYPYLSQFGNKTSSMPKQGKRKERAGILKALYGGVFA